jgi:translation initiation factor 1 (eIF-1/SUI1)
VIFREGKRVKKVEGVPVSAEDQELLREMREKGQSGATV